MRERKQRPKHIFHAVNIHQGGGLILLQALMDHFPGDVPLVLHVDERASIAAPSNATVIRIKPTLLTRVWAEFRLLWKARFHDTVTCLGNLPPLFRLKAYTRLFLQNRLLLEPELCEQFPWKARLRMQMERIWLHYGIRNVDEILVQTPTMQRLAKKVLGEKCKVTVKAFAQNLPKSSVSIPQEYDFIYVASGDPHKNHEALIQAWCLLAQEGVFPRLLLTIDQRQYSDVWQSIKLAIKTHGLQIDNLDAVSRDELVRAYAKTRALIYPSLMESFGLPLIEAQSMGLDIVASERDYVWDVVSPNRTFDPTSPQAIARAVKRYLGLNHDAVALHGADDFVQNITQKGGV